MSFLHLSFLLIIYNDDNQQRERLHGQARFLCFYQLKRKPTGTVNVTGCSFRIVRSSLPSGI